MAHNPDVEKLLAELNSAIERYSQEEETPQHEQTIIRLLRDYPELSRMCSTSDGLGEYPLHRAANHNCTFAMYRLLEAGAEVDAVSSNQFRQTPLHVAARGGWADACVLLVKAGADLTRREANGFTPLMGAIYSHREAVIGCLLMLGAPMDLRAAVSLRQSAIVRLMLRNKPQLVHEEPDATDLVAEAVSCGNMDVLRLLLEAGADSNAARVSYPSLYTALGSGDQAVTELLLEYGADPDREVKPGFPTARQYAAEKGLKWALDLFNRAKGKPPTA